MDRWIQTRKTDHGSEYHVDRTSLYNLIECLGTSIYLDIGQIAHE